MKINYDLKLQEEIQKLGNCHPSLLLHVCCGPCSSNVIKELSEHFQITIYYSNSNIYPPEEYQRRFHELLSFKPAAIRGNASEIMALAGIANGGRGVDTTDAAANAIPAAQTLARETGAIVVVTGEVDYVTDGRRTVVIHGGDPLMTKVVGTGCALSAVVAACCTLPGDTLENIASACHWMKQAGERAVASSEGPGSFVPHFLDALWQLTQEVQA